MSTQERPVASPQNISDQGGFSSELLLDPERHSASILVVNTTHKGVQPTSNTSQPQPNTEPNPKSDLRQTLRTVIIDSLFPAYANKN